MTTSLNEEIAELPKELRFAFSPLVKRALGLAFGLTFGLSLLAMTFWHMAFDRDPAHMQHLYLLRHNFFRGYDPETLVGAFIGFFWALWAGFVLGWFTAALRNFFVAVWIISIRAKANLKANRDFLDHI